MDMWVTANGSRARLFGVPYIDQSECYKNMFFFNPNGRGHNDNLYGDQLGEPPCKSARSAFVKFVENNPGIRPKFQYNREFGKVPMFRQCNC